MIAVRIPLTVAITDHYSWIARPIPVPSVVDSAPVSTPVVNSTPVRPASVSCACCHFVFPPSARIRRDYSQNLAHVFSPAAVGGGHAEGVFRQMFNRADGVLCGPLHPGNYIGLIAASAVAAYVAAASVFQRGFLALSAEEFNLFR